MELAWLGFAWGSEGGRGKGEKAVGGRTRQGLIRSGRSWDWFVSQGGRKVQKGVEARVGGGAGGERWGRGVEGGGVEEGGGEVRGGRCGIGAGVVDGERGSRSRGREGWGKRRGNVGGDWSSLVV